ncbi:MAG: esterase-like activity of phytase family protein [Bdellovibrionaceae bacterium]|nr:esterase-like activity of phytase family protein [Pseudobdellovibrionaceae bacterium]
MRRTLFSILLLMPFVAFGSGALRVSVPVSGKRLPAHIAEETAPPKLELLGVFEIPGTEEFQKTRVGGLSGLVWDESQKIFWAVSDDRGRVNEPRVYGFEFTPPAKGKEPAWKLAKVVTLKDPKSDPKNKKTVWDFEGIALLPWGNWLIVSEGDMNQKPRVNSRVMEFKLSGEFVRDYEVPADYLATPSGRQKTGPRNNFSFEGLAGHADGNHWVVASELGLLQDKGEVTRLLEYTQTEAWVLKPGREWFYPLSPASAGTGAPLVIGVSEVLHARDQEWWVMERGAGISVSGLTFRAELFRVELGTNQELTKTPLLNFGNMGAKFARNFEALSWGPTLPDGRRLLVVLSDNNLEKNEPTVFATFAVDWPKPVETE